MMIRALYFLAVFSFITSVCSVSLYAQQGEPDVIRVESRLVSIETLVTDAKTKLPVGDLRREDFEVLDDNHPVTLTHFSRGGTRERPLALVLLVGLGDENRAVVPRLRVGLERALKRLQPEDQVAVMVFTPSNYELLQELTPNRERVLAALDAAATRFRQTSNPKSSKTESSQREYKKFEALPAALVAAAHGARAHQSQARLTLVAIDPDFSVVSEGRVVNEAAEHLLADNATVSGLLKADFGTSIAKLMVRGMTAPAGNRVKTDTVAYLSRQTGGETVDVRGDEYSDALERLIGNLVERYSIGFVPDEKTLDGRFHKLTVRIKDSTAKNKKRKLKIRARAGYYAVQNSGE